jgi:hypothetical protein
MRECVSIIVYYNTRAFDMFKCHDVNLTFCDQFNFFSDTLAH